MNTPKNIETNKAHLNLTRWRRCILVLVGFVTVVAGFYAVEDWRGKRAWEKCKREIEAKGESVDWSAFIPPPVADEQNFFKAPKMAEWLTGRGATEFSKAIGQMPVAKDPIVIADITVIHADPKAPLKGSDILVQIDDPEASTKTEAFIKNVLGRFAIGSMNFTFFDRSPDQQHISTIFVQSEKSFSGLDLQKLFAPGRAIFSVGGKGGSAADFKIETVAIDSFRLVSNSGFYLAADYLRWCDEIDPHFEPIRTALSRPFARMEGDYEHAFNSPIPNFVTLRQISQTLSQRAQCYLLLNQPDKALEQLTLIHNLCRTLEARPSGKPMTLVAAMINVAIQGVCVNVVADGLRLHAWHDAELKVLEAQLEEVTLPLLVQTAFQSERAAECQLFEQSSARELAKIFDSKFKDNDFWQRCRSPFYLVMLTVPRGWRQQNMVLDATILQQLVDCVNSPRGRIWPQRADAFATFESRYMDPLPYQFLAAMALPNFTKAISTTARNQTYVNCCYMACALERYRLANERFPEDLKALMPAYAGTIPVDIISGEPLHYGRREDGFSLYSLGWNERDDGGVVGDTVTDGDWVWSYPLKF